MTMNFSGCCGVSFGLKPTVVVGGKETPIKGGEIYTDKEQKKGQPNTSDKPCGRHSQFGATGDTRNTNNVLFGLTPIKKGVVIKTEKPKKPSFSAYV